MIDKKFAGMAFYIVQNRDGLFFRAKGMNGSGESWIADPMKAKVYSKIGPARAKVTFFANKHPSFGVPKILKLEIGKVTVMEEKERVEKSVKKIKDDKKKREKELAEWELEMAEINLKQTQELINAMRGK